MPSFEVERCLTVLFTSADARKLFLELPELFLDRFPLTHAEREGLLKIDTVGLALAGDCFGAKRARSTRLMHSSVGAVHYFERYLDDELLATGSNEVRRYLERYHTHVVTKDRHSHSTCDLIESAEPSSHNREYLLHDRSDLSAISKIWLSLKSSALKGHHLLRCFQMPVGRMKQVYDQTQTKPSLYMTYLPMSSDEADTIEIRLTLMPGDECAGFKSFDINPGSCVVVPAQIRQEFEFLGPRGGTDNASVLVFKSLASIE